MLSEGFLFYFIQKFVILAYIIDSIRLGMRQRDLNLKLLVAAN
jgi:hypothetical protein